MADKKLTLHFIFILNRDKIYLLQQFAKKDVTMNLEKFSLLYPKNKDVKYKTLTKEAINDLSIDYLCEALTADAYERNSIKKLLINITDDEEVIRYRCDVFEDFLRFPKLRDDMTALLLKLFLLACLRYLNANLL